METGKAVHAHLSVGEIEKSLIAIWQEVLPNTTDTMPTGSPFLDLGGDSLSAMICITRIRAAFVVEFEIVDFFLDDSTISDFSRRIYDLRAR
jgi:acyl carrier protein